MCFATGVPDRCPIFYGTPVLKLPSHLAKSRHGVFYFRLSTRVGSATRETRLSLRTKNPQEARLKAACLTGIMAAQEQERKKAMGEARIDAAQWLAKPAPQSSFLLDMLHKMDRQQLADLAGLPLSKVNEVFNGGAEPDVRRLDIEMPGGFSLRNINTDDDASRAIQILKQLNLSPETFAQVLAGGHSAALAAPVPRPVEPKVEEGGTTIQEMVPRFATRKKNKLAAKTLYEYGNYHRKFVEWLELRKKKKHIAIHSITRADVADFIDDLLHEGLAEKTISQKYLAAISGLFEMAQSIGLIPQGQQLVSRGHKILSKLDLKKAEVTNSYKPFTVGELNTIFQPQLLSQAQRPADFWLPMLGLFTGGRISELSQLDVSDVQELEGIWALSLNEEGDKSLKTPAAIRLIPIHPTLIECGFLDYLVDAKAHGHKLFPYLTPDAFGSYGGTPGDRWGKYLDKLEITDKQKVFHSFRSTSNDRLKKKGVAEESRCQFIGHEHDTVNSATYSNPHDLQFLLDHVASKLDYSSLDFGSLKYRSGQLSDMLATLCKRKIKQDNHRKARAERLRSI